MSGFAHLGYAEGSLPVTEEVADEIFSLPMYPSLTADEQDRVIGTLRTYWPRCDGAGRAVTVLAAL